MAAHGGPLERLDHAMQYNSVPGGVRKLEHHTEVQYLQSLMGGHSLTGWSSVVMVAVRAADRMLPP